MLSLEELRRRISSVSDMQSVVSLMKTMAAVSVRQYDAAADAMAEYDNVVSLGLHALLREHPVVPPRRAVSASSIGVVILGSDQGLCGQFNDDTVKYAAADSVVSESTDIRSVVIGARAASRLAENSRPMERRLRVPATVAEITTLLQDLMPHILAWQDDGVERIVVYFNRRESVASYVPSKLQLLPLTDEYLERCRSMKWESRSLPMLGAEWQPLFAATIRQYLFSGLFRVCAESRACENASRITAMQAAEKNIDRRLTELRSSFNTSRQTVITEELLDVVTGFEALTQSPPS
ncbi:MAG: F0F1 ATP synthase subunit gamma [Planctomycetales bacterium]|nr:F0F1 ATP synthase subunit gamma [Planctomycetales bacterium]